METSAAGATRHEAAGLARVATVSFLASRAVPSSGFWVALAGGVALARAALRDGIRLGYGASVAATLQTIALIGPARLNIPLTQALTAPLIGALEGRSTPVPDALAGRRAGVRRACSRGARAGRRALRPACGRACRDDHVRIARRRTRVGAARGGRGVARPGRGRRRRRSVGGSHGRAARAHARWWRVRLHLDRGSWRRRGAPARPSRDAARACRHL